MAFFFALRGTGDASASPDADVCAVNRRAWVSETCGDEAMSTTDIHYLGLVEVGQQVQAKKLSPVEVTKAMLERIERLDGKLKSYAYVMAESALAEAAAAEKEIASGKVKGPLHGVPIAIKDLCWAKGAPAAHGMTIHRDFRPSEDATVVARLKDAGAIILGKLQQTEGAYADHHPKDRPAEKSLECGFVARSVVERFGRRRPRPASASDRSGTDTGGSIRFPSAANGITGLKPTWGRVSRYGAFELAATLDHIGPMTRSAIDCGAMLGVIAGRDPEGYHRRAAAGAGLSRGADRRSEGRDDRHRSALDQRRHGRGRSQGAQRGPACRGRSRRKNPRDHVSRSQGGDRRLVPALRHRGSRRA